MIYGNLSNPGDWKSYPAIISRALKILLDTDLQNASPGKYFIDGDDFYYNVSRSKLDTLENKLPESHKKFIDIQLSLIGGEIMGYAVDTGNNPVKYNLIEEKDVLNYQSVVNERFIKMNPMDFFVFFPWDIHRPGVTDTVPEETRKIIVKISVKYL
jgi:YhcH/YjgK/YiaL family protein